MSDSFPNHLHNFVDLIQYRAQHHPDQVAYRFLLDGEKLHSSLTYTQLDQKARAIAVKLHQFCKPGDRALMMYPAGLEFVAAFYGCLYAGMVAVPAYPPRRNRKLERLQSMIDDCFKENRQHARAALELPIQVTLNPIVGQTVNLSPTGALVAVEESQAFDNRLNGKLATALLTTPDGEQLELDCKLIHVMNQQMGIHFLDELFPLLEDTVAKSHDSAPGIVLTESQTLAVAQPQFMEVDELKAIPWLVTDRVELELAPDYRQPKINAEQLAFLQYTSGSTGDPKGVMISHRNMLENCAAIYQATQLDQNARAALWLPLFHDLGLVNGVLMPIYANVPVALMDPTSFLQKPVRWLEMISRLQATHSGGPNFAYDLCVKVVEPEQLAHLDLSSWKNAFSGAEPIRADTITAFSTKFATCGFNPSAHFPSYGMAEATVFIASIGQGEGVHLISVATEPLKHHKIQLLSADSADSFAVHAQTMVGCGRVWGEHQLLIVDPQQKTVCSEDQVGEIWFRGPSVAQGYWNRMELNRQVFHALTADTQQGPFLRTGDLGFIHQDQLYITGRLKDVIIIRGRNYYPQDIEHTVEQCHPALYPTSTAAFTLDLAGEEKLVVVQEIKRTHLQKLNVDEVMNCIRQAVSEQHELSLHAIVLLKPGRIPKTSSGKIQRRNCKAKYQAGELDPIVVQEQVTGSGAAAGQAAATGLYTDERAQELANWLAERVSIVAGVALKKLDHTTPLTRYGLDSINAMRLTGELEVKLQHRLSQSLLWEYDTIQAIANQVVVLMDQAEQKAALTDTFERIPQTTADAQHHYLPFALNPIQQVYWMGRGQAFELGNIACHFYAEFQRSGLDTVRLNQAWQSLIVRHPMLRAIIRADGQQQILAEIPAYTFGSSDLRQATAKDSDARLLATRQRMSHQVFDPAIWPLFEIHVSQLPYNQTRVHLSFDLLVADFWSFLLIYREWEQLYKNPALALPALHYSFRDYVLAEQALQQTAAYQHSLHYWQNRLADFAPAPDLPLRCHPSSVKNPQFVRRSATLSEKTWNILRERAQKVGLTGSIILCAAYAEVLRTWSKNQSCFTLNLTLFNRIPFHPQVNQLVGDFTTLNLLEVDHRHGESFEQRTRRLQKQLWQDLDHRNVNGVEVLRQLAQARGQQAANMPVVFTSALGLKGLQGLDDGVTHWLGSKLYTTAQTPQVWLEQQVFEENGTLIFTWDAIEALFYPAMLDDMFAAYCQLLNDLATDEKYWHQTQMALLPRKQLEKRAHYNDVSQPVTDVLLQTLVAKQVEQNPAHPAVIAADRRLSYLELYQLANQVAHQLRAWGARPNQHVAIVMEKGWQQVVAALAIIQAGAAYLPIAPELPVARQAYLLEQAEVEVVLTQAKLVPNLTLAKSLRCLAIDAEALAQPTTALVPIQTTTDLAYTIFTSGSTGVPKGVMIDHRGVVNTLLDINQRFAVTAADRIFGISALNFDLSVYDIFGLLIAGGTLVLPAEDQRRDPAQWLAWLKQEKITLWNSVPQLVALLVDHLNQQHKPLPPDLRVVMMSGDWVPLGLPSAIKSLAANRHVGAGGSGV